MLFVKFVFNSNDIIVLSNIFVLLNHSSFLQQTLIHMEKVAYAELIDNQNLI